MGPNSLIVVYVDPLGIALLLERSHHGLQSEFWAPLEFRVEGFRGLGFRA